MKKDFKIVIVLVITIYTVVMYFVFSGQNKAYLKCLNEPHKDYTPEMLKISQGDCLRFKQSFFQVFTHQRVKNLLD